MIGLVGSVYFLFLGISLVFWWLSLFALLASPVLPLSFCLVSCLCGRCELLVGLVLLFWGFFGKGFWGCFFGVFGLKNSCFFRFVVVLCLFFVVVVVCCFVCRGL